MDAMNQFAPLAGFAVALLLLLSALALFLLFLWILVPFSVFAIHRQSDRQVELLGKIESRLRSLETSALALGGVAGTAPGLTPPAAEYPPSSLG